MTRETRTMVRDGMQCARAVEAAELAVVRLGGVGA